MVGLRRWEGKRDGRPRTDGAVAVRIQSVLRRVAALQQVLSDDPSENLPFGRDRGSAVKGQGTLLVVRQGSIRNP